MLPRKIFENLHSAVAIFALFEQFSGKFCLKLLPLNLSVSPNMMHFVRTFSMTRALGVRLIVIEKGPEIMEKLHSSKTCLKMAGGGVHPPYTPWIRPCPH